ncbi:MAG: hypothetical protein JW931_09745 [Methanomicrobiaceae archaeon]|nr:hypothetical protein [Methanomicrobiaceae archaeon]
MLSLTLLAGSLALSAVLFLAGLPFFFMFLFIPVIPLLGSPKRSRICPVCGWTTSGNELYCPYDGTYLEEKNGI